MEGYRRMEKLWRQGGAGGQGCVMRRLVYQEGGSRLRTGRGKQGEKNESGEAHRDPLP